MKRRTLEWILTYGMALVGIGIAVGVMALLNKW